MSETKHLKELDKKRKNRNTQSNKYRGKTNILRDQAFKGTRQETKEQKHTV